MTPKRRRDAVVLLDIPFRPDPTLWRRVAAECNRCPTLTYACRFGAQCEGTAARCA